MELSVSAYVVLGLIARHGPMTTRELRVHAENSVGPFWPIPPARLDGEPAALAERGLLAERPGDGPNPRAYRLTSAGERALRAWLASADAPPAGDGDPAQVRLAFADLGDADDLVRLARAQAARHGELLARLRAERAALSADDPEAASRSGDLDLALVREQAHAAFWQTLAAAGDDEEPDDADDAPGAGRNGSGPAASWRDGMSGASRRS